MNKSDLKKLLIKYGIDIDIEQLENSDLIDFNKLLSEGTLQYDINKLLKEGYTINEFGEIVPPLYGIKEFAEEIGWDRRKVAVYKGRENKLPIPSCNIKSRGYWTKKQIEKFKKNL